MRQRDGAILTMVCGALAVEVALTEQFLKFVRPGMRPYIVASGLALIVIAVPVLIATRWGGGARGEGGDSSGSARHAHAGSRVGWLLLAPLLVAVIIAPGTFGSWAAARQRGVTFAIHRDFDFGAYLRTQQVAGVKPSLKLIDFLEVASQRNQRELLAKVDIEIKGFVSHEVDDPPGTFRINRFAIGCCAGDASLMQVEVRGARTEPSVDAWISATIRFSGTLTPVGESYVTPVVRLVEMKNIKTPSNPFEYLY